MIIETNDPEWPFKIKTDSIKTYHGMSKWFGVNTGQWTLGLGASSVSFKNELTAFSFFSKFCNF
jgi:hypothetical protein